MAGTIGTSLSKWFLLWLFAQSSGGPGAVGAYSSILAFATPLFVVCQLGLRTIFLSLRVRYPWSVFVRLRMLGACVGALVLGGFIFLAPGVPLWLGVAILALKVCDSFQDISLARVQYGNNLVALGAIVFSGAVMTAVAALTLVWVTGDVPAGVLAAASVSFGAGCWGVWVSRRVGYEPDSITSGIESILRVSVRVTTSQFLASLLFQLPIVFLAILAGPSVVGVFAAAGYLLTAAALVGSSLQTVLITPFRRLMAEQGKSGLWNASRGVTARVVAGGTIFGIFVVLLGNPVLNVVYGGGFGMHWVPLALLAVAACSTVGAFVLSVTLTVLNRYGVVTWGMGGACLMSALSGVSLAFAGVDPLLIGTAMSAIGAIGRLVLMYWMVRTAVREVEQE